MSCGLLDCLGFPEGISIWILLLYLQGAFGREAFDFEGGLSDGVWCSWSTYDYELLLMSCVATRIAKVA